MDDGASDRTVLQTVLLVVDRGEGFNRRGIPSNKLSLKSQRRKEAELALPPSPMFWSRVTNKPGNMPYVREKGEDMAVLNAVEAITSCPLR